MGVGYKSLPSHPSGARSLLEDFLQQLPSLPPAAVYVTIAVLAATENLFPLVPADTAVAFGAFLSNAGAISATAVFGVTWVANVASASAMYIAARTLGRRFVEGPIGRRLLSRKALTKIERWYLRYGTWGIFLSRFVPGVRAVVPPFAGIAGLGAVRALLPVAVASGIWYGVLTWVAATLIPKLDDVARLVVGLNKAALLLMGALAIGIAVWVLARRWTQRTRTVSAEVTMNDEGQESESG